MRTFSISILNLFLYFSLLSFPLAAKDLIENKEDFLPFQEVFSKEEVEQKISQALQKDQEVTHFYKLTDRALFIYASAEMKKLDQPEFTLYLGSKSKPNTSHPLFNKHPYLPLKGVRVAIDPGHVGGKHARLEERYIHMKPSERHGIDHEIEFNEGELVVVTAKRLAAKLKALGADVLLTKTQAGSFVYNKDFSAWLDEDFDRAVELLVSRQDNLEIQRKEAKFWKEEANENQVFRSTYNFLDVERRAELINAFNPHLTITCHYNLGGIYDDKGLNPGTNDDYTIFFVPGAFKRGSLKDESFRKSSLKNPRSRYEFVRLLVTDDIEQSVQLAQIARRHAKHVLKLPTGDHCNYLKVLCLKHSEGIYHRNLVLTRLVHGPILYCEPFCQDNYLQAKVLSINPDLKIDQVVEVYLRSVLDWVDLNSQR